MTSDAPSAVSFYERVFGYTHDEMQMPEGIYYLLKSGDRMRGGVMQSTLEGIPPNWMPYVSVADADATASKARELGGRLAVEPTDFPGVGRFAIVLDPQGAAVGVLRVAAA